MNVLAVIAALLLVLILTHPVAALLVLGGELAVCAGLGWLIWRGLRAVMQPPAWRRAA